MNLLTDALPTEIDGLAIKTDFRVWLRVRALMEDVEPKRMLADVDYFFDAMTGICKLIYTELPEMFTGALFVELMNFLACRGAEQINPDKARGEAKQGANIFDMDFDSGAIYASFLMQYGIDLTRVKTLHWFKFYILLQNLTDDTPLRVRTKIRGMKSSEVGKDKLKELQRVQSLYRVPASEADRTAKEALTAFLQKGGV